MASPKDSLDLIEARRKVTKLDLELRLLLRSVSFWGAALEWLKAASVPVAMTGVAVTFILGAQQLNRAEIQRQSDQLDKTITRMLTGKEPERVAGVGGLALFLTPDLPNFHAPAMTYLINALAVEDDETVRASLLHTLSSQQLVRGNVRQEALDTALNLAVVHNRRLTRKILDSGKIARMQSIPSFLKERPGADLFALSDAEYLEYIRANTTQPLPIVAGPSIKSGRDVRNASQTLNNNTDDLELKRLVALADAIEELLALGARAKDLSGIYCEACDFSRTRLRNLSKVHFEKAILRRANLTILDLQGAQFQDADLRGALFIGSNLSKADLSVSEVNELTATLSDSYGRLPNFECADLSEANLSGLVLGDVDIFFRFDLNVVATVSAYRSNMRNVKVSASTKFDRIGFVVRKVFPEGIPSSSSTSNEILFSAYADFVVANSFLPFGRFSDEVRDRNTARWSIAMGQPLQRSAFATQAYTKVEAGSLESLTSGGQKSPFAPAIAPAIRAILDWPDLRKVPIIAGYFASSSVFEVESQVIENWPLQAIPSRLAPGCSLAPNARTFLDGAEGFSYSVGWRTR